MKLPMIELDALKKDEIEYLNKTRSSVYIAGAKLPLTNDDGSARTNPDGSAGTIKGQDLYHHIVSGIEETGVQRAEFIAIHAQGDICMQIKHTNGMRDALIAFIFGSSEQKMGKTYAENLKSYVRAYSTVNEKLAPDANIWARLGATYCGLRYLNRFSDIELGRGNSAKMLDATRMLVDAIKGCGDMGPTINKLRELYCEDAEKHMLTMRRIIAVAPAAPVSQI